MSVPSSYDDVRLAQFMHVTLGKTAETLGWSAPDSYDEAVVSATLLYGVTDIAEATDIPKLRACARLAVWRAVEADTAGHFQFTSDGQSFHREMVHKHAAQMAQKARREAQKHGIEYSVTTTRVERVSPFFNCVESEVQ